MPIYEYRCAHCGHELERMQDIMARPLKRCPSCGKFQLERLITGGAGFKLNGDGFYGKGRVNTGGGSVSY